jgi:hypothetical protein
MSQSSHSGSNPSGSKIGARAGGTGKAVRKSKSPLAKSPIKNPIVIDEANGLVFDSERDLYKFFAPQISMLEAEVQRHRGNDDLPTSEFKKFEPLLQQVIDDPDEIWEDVATIHGLRVTSYVGHYVVDPNKRLDDKSAGVYYVALAYAVEGNARFIYLHFPSRDLKLIDRFRRGELVYDRIMKEVEKGAVEGDALSEGDGLAVGLYKAMLALRNAADLSEEVFRDFESSREPTIEEPDEIWRSADSGQTLVTFVKKFDEESGDGKEFWYLAVTVEDQASSSHALLFSFPTTDENLVDRYRHGENLQAEEVTQEASH